MRVNKNKLMLAMARQCISLQEVAEKANLPYVTLKKALTGKRSTLPKTVGKVARALGVDVTEIIELEDFQ